MESTLIVASHNENTVLMELKHKLRFLINWPLHTRDFSRELSGFSCIIGMRMV